MSYRTKFRTSLVILATLGSAVLFVSYRAASKKAAATHECQENSACEQKKAQTNYNLIESISHNLLSTSSDAE